MLGWLAVGSSLSAEVLNFRTYSVKEGLGQSQVFTIFQASDGYLWVGTDGGGLSRFDGFQFETFTERDGLSDNVIYSIIQDRQGELWIGTAAGVTIFDGRTFRPFEASESILDQEVWCITEDPDGSLWFATYGDGLVHYANGDLIPYSEADGLPSNDVRHVSVDGSGRVWGATPYGAFVWENRQITVFTREQGLPSNDVRTTAEDASGARWFATDQGVTRFDGETWQTFTSAEGLADDDVWGIFAEPDNSVWFTTSNGVSRFDGREFHSWTTRHGLPYPLVEMMIRDRENNLWLATDAGLARFSGYHIRSIRVEDGLPDPNVWGFGWDRSGQMWIATEAALVRYDPRLEKVLPEPIKPEKGFVFPLMSDRQGDLWFGLNGRLFRFDGRQCRDLTTTFGLPEMSVFAIEEDHRGQIWIGTEQDGITLLSHNRLMNRFGVKDGLVSNMVNDILEDRKGRIWIATNHGVSWYDGESFHSLDKSDGVLDRFVMAAAEDAFGTLWFATYGDGVVGYDPETEKAVSITSNDGLIDDAAGSLIVDHDGVLWIGTNQGVSCLDTEQYHRRHTLKLRSYGYPEGFVGIECNQGAIALDEQGAIWVGTIGGAFCIDPKERNINLVEPATQITGIQLFLEPLDPSFCRSGSDRAETLPNELSLPAAQNHLTFDFTGISLTAPERVQFQFKLHGFDSEWSPVTTQRHASYANLPPGEFTFLVKACNSDGLWNRDPVSFSFRILTPWWRTRWFSVLATVSIGGGILVAFRLRTRSHRHRQRQLEAEIEARTYELHQEKQKVEQINRELEDRVRERTEKLTLANERLVQAEKMEVLGKLAGGVAHDLNNILSGLVTYPDLLLMRLPPDSSLRDYVVGIRRSGERAAGVVQDLLTLARRGIRSETEVNLNAVIEEYMSSPEYAQLMANHPAVEIRRELDPLLPGIVGSQVHLSKSLMNLVTNAVEAIPHEGGLVTITTQPVELSAPLKGSAEVPPGRYAAVMVADTGIGISAEDLNRIFEPFYSKKKLGWSGSGLGMTVIWGTVTDHNGYITVDSTERSGTTFSLYFPISEQARQNLNMKPTVDQLRGHGERILLVDDLEEQRTMGSDLLEQLGYEVETAANGEDTISFIRDREYDLVILDMIMEPGIDGLETFLRIREIRPKQRAIIMSGYSETSRVREAMNLGVTAYVQKPYSLIDFGRAIRLALEDEKG